jgi:hypothetical protein
MKRKTELLCAWSGVPFVSLFFIGLLVLAHFVPPLSPNSSAEQITAIYQGETNSIRTGLLLCFLGTMFMLAFGAAIVGQTKRIKGVAPTINTLQTASFACAVLIIIFPIMCWWTAAFRPNGRPAETIQLINDLGWLCFVVGFAPYITWCASVGLAVLSDTSATPLFPRWAGYLSFVVALAQMPPGLLVYFKTGPFAWDGVVSFWIPLFDFFPWILVMIVLTVRAINRPDYDALDLAGRPAVTSRAG